MRTTAARRSLALLVCACDGSAGYNLVIRFDPPSLADSVSRIEVALGASCEKQIPGEAPPSAVDEIEIVRGKPAPRFSSLPPGDYGLSARGLSPACDVVAAGCDPVQLEAGGEGELIVTLRAIEGPQCPNDLCRDKDCTLDPDGGDGGIADASVDGDAADAEVCGTIELCNGIDDNCDGTTDEDCPCPLVAPENCNLDGDGFPQMGCETAPSVSDTVFCVCDSPPCADALCDDSETTVAAALAALGAITTPSYVWVVAGSYSGFTVSNTGTSETSPLVVAARCASGVRDAVTLTSGITVSTPHVRVEGFRVDVSGLGESGVWLDPLADQTVLRDLTIAVGGSAPSISYLACTGSFADLVEGLLVEGVEILNGTVGKTLAYAGARFRHCPAATVRRSAACGMDGVAWQVEAGSDGVTFQAVLARDSADEGFKCESDGTVLDGVLALGNGRSGARLVLGTSGHAIRNSRFTNNFDGVYISDAQDVDVFNNLFEDNVLRGLLISITGPLSVTRVSFNTFVSNGENGVQADGSETMPITIGEFWGNVLSGHNGSDGDAAIRRNYTTATSAGENLYWDNTAGSAENCLCTGGCAFTNECFEGALVTEEDPLYTTSSDGDPYFLSQPPGELETSPAVDMTSIMAATACSGDCLGARTTSTTGDLDTGFADAGYHYPVCP